MYISRKSNAITYQKCQSFALVKGSNLLETNRFNPTPYTPFMQDNETKELGFTNQTFLGEYKRNQPLVEFDEIKKIGHQIRPGHHKTLLQKAAGRETAMSCPVQ